MSKLWFAIRTAAQRERAVELVLSRKGYAVFLPLEFKTRYRGKSRGARKEHQIIALPLFPRYLFVGGEFNWPELMSERHVVGVVGFNGRPAPIRDEEMNRVREIASSLPTLEPKKRSPRVGDLVKINGGAFAGHVVKIEGLHGRKARIFMNLFGSRKVVEIDAANLEAA